ncbi:MAG: hypothetical protein IGS39_08695 [Calothrix sp. C42_A2020_038]|nr:hypothetical protein [Calothrix sp. C42_A2020_038]
MAFSDYKTIAEVLKEYQVTYTEANFIVETPFNISNYFREDLELMLRDAVVDCSEYAICENLIYPVIKEVWKVYRTKFVLWSHRSLNFDKKLSGYPEYILATRSPLGKIVFDKPYFILVEAKQDDFEGAWAQCLAEMIAAQKLNNKLKVTIYGITSNGGFWQFGKLEENIFSKNIKYYTIQQLEELFAAVNYTFQQCEAQLENLLAA